MMATEVKYFDSGRDNAVLEAGGFFCLACLVGKPASEQSPDPRYCQGCYEYLMDEATRLTSTKRPAWVPKSPKIGGQKLIPVVEVGSLIMHTIKPPLNQSVHNSPENPVIPSSGKRGPKFRDDLPEDLIKQWAGRGMGLKAIAARLRGELGVKVHYTTVLRLLQRSML